MKNIAVIETSGLRAKKNCIPSLRLAYFSSYFRDKKIRLKCVHLDNLISNNNGCDSLASISPLAFKPYLSKGVLSDKDSAELNKVMKLVNLKGKDFVAFSISGENTESLFALIKMIKRKTNLPNVLGGYITIDPKLLLTRYPFIDYIILGPGFKSLHELVTGKDKGRINGLYYRKGKNISSNKPAYNIEHDKLMPDFDYIKKDDYRYSFQLGNKSFNSDLILPFQFIFRCPFSCAYCYNSLFPYRGRHNASDIVKQVIRLKKQYKTSHFAFMNPMCNINRNFSKELARELIDQKADINWTDSFLPSNVDIPTIKLLKKSGLIGAYFGVDSGSQKILNYINKRVTISDAKNTLKNFSREGIWNIVNFIIGFPYENSYDRRKTMSFINDTCGDIDTLLVNILSLIPSRLLFWANKYSIKVAGTDNYSKLRRTYFQKYGLRLDLFEYFPYYKFIETKTRKVRDLDNILKFKYLFDRYSKENTFDEVRHLVNLFTLYKYFGSKNRIYNYLRNLQK